MYPIKPEEIRHLTDTELLLVKITNKEVAEAWKKEFKLRHHLINYHKFLTSLTVEEFNGEKRPINRRWLSI